MYVRATIVVLLVLVTASSAFAQSFAIHADTPGGLSRTFDVGAEVFDIVTTLEAPGHNLSAVEWQQTELNVFAPGIFKVGTSTINCGTCDPPNDHSQGVYLEYASHCIDLSTPLWLATVSYLDVGGVIPADTVLEISGVQPGGPFPSRYDGDPGFLDCSQNEIAGVMDGGPALMTGSGAIVPSGAMVLNPTPVVAVESKDTSVAVIKSRFR